jgi:hypothetical protein
VITPKNHEVSAGPPSDLELMRLHDGELDDATRERLEGQLDGQARDKLRTMALLGEVLQSQVEHDERGDAIVDAVMAGLDEIDAGGEDVGAELLELSDRRPEPALPLQPTGKGGKPANDNARIIYAATALAAAVALGLFFWGSSDPSVEIADSGRSGPTSLLPETAAAPVAAAAPSAEEEDEDASEGVEIASVDFGSQSGSVFYVSNDPSAGRTAVVWVTEIGDDQ